MINVILFGASGMVGQGVLRECLLSDDVSNILSIGRSRTGQTHAKLREVETKDVGDLSAIEADLAHCDACFFCLGVSSAGMSEEEYSRITHDLTLRVARTLHAANPNMTFIYVSGTGTDSSEKGGSMWAQVKGRTENELLAMGFKAAYMFRPGIIQPLDGIKSKTRLYSLLYAVTGPIFPILKALAPKSVTTTRQVGRAMIALALRGSEKRHFENVDINAVE
jgi:uncharacterized protein YbjT (DUF2867 family)